MCVIFYLFVTWETESNKRRSPSGQGNNAPIGRMPTKNSTAFISLLGTDAFSF